MALIEDIRGALVVGNAPQVSELTQKALDEGAAALDILNDGLVAGMDIVAAKWKAGEYYIPNVLIAARAMKQGMELIKPKLVEGDYKAKAVAVAGTVKGDLHDIGKNLVVMMMEGAGIRGDRPGHRCPGREVYPDRQGKERGYYHDVGSADHHHDVHEGRGGRAQGFGYRR